MPRHFRKRGSMAGITHSRLVNNPTRNPCEAERIALALLEKPPRTPRQPKPVTLRKFSWEEDSK